MVGEASSLPLPFGYSVTGCGQNTSFWVSYGGSCQLLRNRVALLSARKLAFHPEEQRGQSRLNKTRLNEQLGSNPGLGELLDLLNLLVGEGVEVADDARAVPLILLQHRLQKQPRVLVPVLVAAEQMAASPLRLYTERDNSRLKH